MSFDAFQSCSRTVALRCRNFELAAQCTAAVGYKFNNPPAFLQRILLITLHV